MRLLRALWSSRDVVDCVVFVYVLPAHCHPYIYVVSMAVDTATPTSLYLKDGFALQTYLNAANKSVIITAIATR